MQVQYSMIGSRGRLFLWVFGLFFSTAVLFFVFRSAHTSPPRPTITPPEDRYHFQQAYHKYNQTSEVYRIAIVADRDTASKVIKVCRGKGVDVVFLLAL